MHFLTLLREREKERSISVALTHANVPKLHPLSTLQQSDPAEKTRQKYQARVEKINALEPAMQK